MSLQLDINTADNSCRIYREHCWIWQGKLFIMYLGKLAVQTSIVLKQATQSDLGSTGINTSKQILFIPEKELRTLHKNNLMNYMPEISMNSELDND